MKFNKSKYKSRIIDKKIEEDLKIFGAISIEGPKWCGKTWAALNNSKSFVFINDSADNFKNKRLAEMDTNLILDKENPELIDEWQIVPEIWDAVRYKCDMSGDKGLYILTGSATPVEDKIYHSGAGRIGKLKMHTMSLYESNESSGDISLKDLFSNKFKNSNVKKYDLKDLSKLIIRGGWPETIGESESVAQRLCSSYIEGILDKDINDIDGVKRDKNKMFLLLKLLARNETTISSNSVLEKDIDENINSDDLTISRNTVADYLSVLNKLHLIENQPSYMYNIGSSKNVGKVSKRHFCDPSLACALLNISYEKLINDLSTFGLLYEALVERDLRIYSESLNGHLYHYRELKGGIEVDAIVELDDGEYGAIEVKLGTNQEEEAAESLLKFYNSVEIKPKFMCIICGLVDACYKRPDGIYVFPITALKP